MSIAPLGQQPPYQVFAVGHIVNGRPHRGFPTRPGHWTLRLVTGGRGFVDMAGRSQPLAAGSLLLAGPDQPGLVRQDPSEPYRMAFCRFTGTWACHEAQALIARHGPVWHLDVSDTTAINDLIRNRPKIRRQRAPVGIGPDELMLVEILWVLAGSPDDVPGNGPQPLSADHLTRWIETHFSDAFDLDRMAGDFGVSRGTLCRAVRQHFQASPLQLVQHRRVEEAKRLLRIPGATVSAVASALGYGHPRPFRDLYRRQTGRSPSDDLVPRALEQRGW